MGGWQEPRPGWCGLGNGEVVGDLSSASNKFKCPSLGDHHGQSLLLQSV